MYITHPTHGAGTRPNGTQPPTGTRKTTLNAGQCVRQPREGRARNRQTPPRKQKRGGGGGGQENGPQPPDRPPTPQEMAKPPARRHRRQDPERGTEGPPSQNWHHQARNSGPPEEGTPKTHRHTPREKKRTSNPPRKRGDGGTGTTRPGTGTASSRQKKNTPRQPDQERRGTAETRAQHPRPHSTPRPGKAGNNRGAPTNTHPQPGGAGDHAGRALQHTHSRKPPKERRDAAETQTRARTPAPHTGNGGVQEERARNHTRPICKPKPKPNHIHHKPQPVKEGRRHKPYPNLPAQGPSQDWRGYLNPHPTTNRTRTQTPHNSRKPSVHSPGTEAAGAMQLTRPNEIRSPGVRLHPKACAALGLEAERAKPKHLGTLVPRTCMHALGTGYARKSSEPLGFRPKEGTCASTGAHPPGETSMSRRRRSALPVWPGAALLGANSQV